ncbi:restriction endonuclease subunit S [Bacteroides acidifaciens]|uniref:Restriction endonuclease subunit S n=2 Tax=Bacteroides acidifaciens TaxID=85831 RepID=A0A4S2AWV5_9BACE|nr:restriction endonuclease subunit S [Bacteroides acidifaciens]TGY06026.1 restriction endonuclease subunit S [Bacteroides acidifaciens]
MNSYYEKFLATGEVKCIDEEIPFEIPQGWEWERVGNVFFVTKLAGFEYTKFFTKEALSASNPIPIVRAQNVRMGFFEENKNEAISEMLSNQLERSALNKKCLLMTFIGAGIGDTCIFPAERKNHLAPNVAKIEPLDDSISLDYAVFALMSPCGQRGVNAIKKSTAQPSLSMETIRKLLIPIPPLKEQKCISLKLSEALPLVEKYSKVQEEQNQLNVEIQYLLKKSILQEAIQGKLVPQIAEEGTAQELLEQIKFEKQKLVKEGRIKMFALNDSIIFRGDDNKYFEKIGKTITDITDEIPFEIPATWQWVRLDDICSYIQRGKSPKYSSIKKYPVIAQKCNQWAGFCIDKAQFIDPNSLPSYAEERLLQDGDLMWNSTGLGTLGRMAIYKSALNPYELAVADSHVTVIRPLKAYVLSQYLYYYFASDTVQSVIEDKSAGSTKQKELSTTTVKNYLVPIPPYREQQRIVEKIKTVTSIMRG